MHKYTNTRADHFNIGMCVHTENNNNESNVRWFANGMLADKNVLAVN